MRTRFKNLLIDKYILFKKEHMQLLKEHCNLDENGNPKIIRDEKLDKNVFDVKDFHAFEKAYAELLQEEVIIAENEENRAMLESVRDSVLNCGIEFTGKEADMYNRFCEIVEQIK